jgi:hypothetical protein
MKKTIPFVLISMCAWGLAFSFSDFNFEEKERIQKVFKFQDSSGPIDILVDNIFGRIDVQGCDGRDVELVIQKTIKAGTKEKIQKAKEDVKLVITQEAGSLEFYVDGPFRCRDSRGNRSINNRHLGYEVHYDFVIRVPYMTNLSVWTVTDGNISVKNVEGTLEVHNVNGRIDLEDVAGAVAAHTVNGKVTATFVRNPESDCFFKTINGNLEVSLCEGLSADFQLKTLNGEAYSDFDVTLLPPKAAVRESRETKYIYKKDSFSRIRIGKGGPEIRMDTFNGNIFIKKRTA